MKVQRKNSLAIAAMMAAVLAIPAAAQSTVRAQANQAAKSQQPTAATKRVIVVSLEDHRLALIEDGKVVKLYSVAVGKPSTPSPVGTFTIARRVMNPTYSHDGRTVAPGPNNPVGSRWMGLSIPGFGIHGTNEPRSIGKAASHGCIRMARADLEELFPLVAVGDKVELIGQRNEETAQLFGDGKDAAPAAQSTQTTLASASPIAQPSSNPATNSAPASPGLIAMSISAAAGSL